MGKIVTITEGHVFSHAVDVLIVGAGACGLCAALAVADQGEDAVVLEKSKTPLGTTSMSTGLIPAAGTPEQAAQDIEDTPAVFAADIMAKNKSAADRGVVKALAETSAETISWLRDTHDIPLSLVDGFVYPGHSYRRMYGTPNRTGSELMAALESAVELSSAEILTDAYVKDLYIDADKNIRGVAYERPDGHVDNLGCRALVLANCGFAGNAEMVAKYIPDMMGATLHTHTANKGEAITWGRDIGARLEDLNAYQGHAGLAAGHGVPILWPTIMQGGFQVNANGQRFSNEAAGYSEQAGRVLAQPNGVAWTIFDQTIYDMMLQFDDFQDAIKAACIIKGDTIAQLAKNSGLPIEALSETFRQVDAAKAGTIEDSYARDFSSSAPLVLPFYAVKVTGALFHTQGGLAVDVKARVLKQDGSPFNNLFAGGGAARGISGQGAAGYIAGNGLLTATSLGKIAGRTAAAYIKSITASKI